MNATESIVSIGKLSLAILLFFSSFTFSGIIANPGPKSASNNAARVILNRSSAKHNVSYFQWKIGNSKNLNLSHISRSDLMARQCAFDKLVLTRQQHCSKDHLLIDRTTQFFQRRNLPLAGTSELSAPHRG